MPSQSVFLQLERLLRQPREAAGEPVLVLAYMPALGYAVHMTPVYEALHRPLRPVLVATTAGANAELLRHCPFVDHVLETPDPQTSFLAAVRSLRRQLRLLRLRPACVLTGPQDARTRIGLLGALACGGWRGGFATHPGLYQRPLRYDRTQSRIANNLRLAELLQCDPEGCIPRVFFSAAQAEAARELLPPGSVLAVVVGNSGGLPTAWHDDRWAAVLRHAQSRLGYHPVFLGTARDVPAIERIRALAGGTSLAGRTDVGTLAAVLAQSDLCVSLMTGTLHVARAVGTPTVALGLAWEPPLEWMTPLEPFVRLLRGPDAARTASYRCDDLSPELVMGALDELARAYPASAESRAERVAHALDPRTGGLKNGLFRV